MQCPYCGSDSQVSETRMSTDGMRRRRLCGTCKRRFTTYEKIGSPPLRVEKRAGHFQPFDSDKMLRALRRVCKGRPEVRDEDLRRLVRDIEASLLDAGKKATRWSELVQETLRRLAAIDAIAARRLEINYLDDGGKLSFHAGPLPRGGAEQLGLFAEGDA
ncbi:MAG: transcriptional repressor NrdR [Myxococcales bacterium]|nr:transcriptional repressor NrdR [Myxococcales bacterium]